MSMNTNPFHDIAWTTLPNGVMVPTANKPRSRKRVITIILGIFAAVVTLIAAVVFLSVPTPSSAAASAQIIRHSAPDVQIPFEGRGTGQAHRWTTADSVDNILAPDAVAAGTRVLVYSMIENGGYTNTASCSLGPVISDQTALIAGHCVKADNSVIVVDGSEEGSLAIGVVTEAVVGGGLDVARIEFTDNFDRSRLAVNDISTRVPAVGEIIHKVGATTGYSGGPVIRDVNTAAQETDSAVTMIDAFSADICLRPGDSGAAVMDTDNVAVGIASGYNGANDGCDRDNNGRVVPLGPSLAAVGIDM